MKFLALFGAWKMEGKNEGEEKDFFFSCLVYEEISNSSVPFFLWRWKLTVRERERRERLSRE